MIFLENSLSQIHHKNPGSCGFRSRQTCRSGSRVSAGNLSTFQMRHRGEYFYLSNVHCCLIFFFSRRNIQFGGFCAEIFILRCIVQKYWSGIVTCYTAITIDYLDLTNVSGMLIQLCKKKRFFWGSCRNITVPSYCITATLCRAYFRVCAEILLSQLLHCCYLVQGLF